jgi:beta-lactamase regulating signal transducer with metallopeptidase domain
MNFIDKILPENLIYSIGWTIIHSFWQGAIISLLLIAFFTLVKTSSATKAKAAVIALGVMVILFMVTFSLEMNSYENPQSINNSLQTSAVGEVLSSAPAKSQGNNSEENISSQFGIARELKYFLAQNISLLTFIWFAGFMFFTLRFLGGFYLIRKLKYTGTSFVPAFWQIRVNSLRYKLKISRPVRMLESINVSIPITIGYVKPVILMPIGMLTGLPANQIGAIIAHELAHIYRDDYLINIIQSVGEIILFYHPAVWWISHKIRTERENSCDDIAISVCGDTLTFAKALANLEEVKMKNRQFALALKSNKSLMGRIKRIVKINPGEVSFMEKALSLVIIVVLLVSTTVFASVSFNPVEKKAVNKYIQAIADTSWKKGEYNFVNENMKVKMKNGKIKELIINGKKISESKFSDYKKMVADTLEAFVLTGPDIPASPPVLAGSQVPPEKAPKPIVALTTKMPDPPAAPKLAELPDHPSKAPDPIIALTADLPGPPPAIEPTYFPAIPDTNVDTSDLSLVLEKNLQEQQMNLKRIQETMEYQQQKLIETTEKMKIKEEKIKNNIREIKEKAKDIKRKNNEFIGNVSNELVGRGIISKGEKFSLELSDKELIINGKVQPDDLLKIVQTLYKKSWGRELESGFNYRTGN